MWAAPVARAQGAYMARVQALELLVTGQPGQGALPVRVTALERHSGL
jgi:hypothetical protein